MKHIKKKFRGEKMMTEEEIENNKNTQISIEEGKKVFKNKGAMIYSESGNSFPAFSYSQNGKSYLIPEPDPILVHFHSSYVLFKEMQNARKKLFDILNTEQFDENISRELYHYFSMCNGCSVFLFTAIEAFINKFIPDNYIFNDIKNNKTEVYNKDQIQRHLSFDVKLKEILPQIAGKDFSKKHPPTWQHIVNLKELRDFVVHTKTDSKGVTPYDYIFKKALNFKYEDAIHAVRDLINFYQPDYVVECDCGEDF